MDFALPQELVEYLAELDRFIEAEIKPLEQADDNIRFFDHRREHARTDWDNQGLPRHEWEDAARRGPPAAPTPPGICAMPGPRRWAARAAATSPWR